MSYEANFDDPQRSGGQVASGKGWIDFTRWAGRLASSPELLALCDTGVSKRLPLLADELQSALPQAPSDSIKATASGLLEMTRSAITRGAKTLVIGS